MTGNPTRDPLRDPQGGRSSTRSAQLMRNWAGRRHDWDAVIVGGGPAGAAAAARLAARGFRIILVDRSTFPPFRATRCAATSSAWPRWLNSLTSAQPRQRDSARPARSVWRSSRRWRQARRPTASAGGRATPYGRGIPRLQLGAWVQDAARRAGATVLGGRKVTAVEQAPATASRPPARGGPDLHVLAVRRAAIGENVG